MPPEQSGSAWLAGRRFRLEEKKKDAAALSRRADDGMMPPRRRARALYLLGQPASVTCRWRSAGEHHALLPPVTREAAADLIALARTSPP